jgi:hypothetical protein
MAGANERALAAVHSAAMSDPSSVSRVEFNLMFQLIEQVLEQVTHVHKLVASITPNGPATTAAEAGSLFTEAALPLPLPSYDTFDTDMDVATTTSKRSGGSKKQKKGGSKKKETTEDVDMFALPPDAPPVPAPVMEEESNRMPNNKFRWNVCIRMEQTCLLNICSLSNAMRPPTRPSPP